MTLLLIALAVFLLCGVSSLACGRRARLASFVGAAGAVVGAAIGLVAAVQVLASAATAAIRCTWHIPFGSLSLAVDPLSALFLLPTLVLAAIAAVHGSRSLPALAGNKSLGPPWFFYHVMIAAIVVVTLARNGVLFLIAWEVMSLAAYFLVTFEDERDSVREAGLTYLIAAHIGAAFVMALFIVLGQGGSLDFDHLHDAMVSTPSVAGVAFLLALVGFGTKCAWVPLHVWLPEADPVAPSHVAAVMSGVMVKMGVYGLLRTLTLLPAPAAWWGWALVAIGVMSGLVGIIHALVQRDLFKMLAYSSIENMGIIALALGIAVLGLHAQSPAVAMLGFAGALLHVFNHALFKGLLFLVAGSIAAAAKTREIAHLGGLLRRMPWTGASFLVGAIAIAGLPPFNGFASEFLIYLGGLVGGTTLTMAQSGPMLGAIVALALIGGFAAVAFAGLFGLTALGEPRSPVTAEATEPAVSMRVATGVLAASCLMLGVLASRFMQLCMPLLAMLSRVDINTAQVLMVSPAKTLQHIVSLASVFLAMLGALIVLRFALLRGRKIEHALTWDCGYARPTLRMQYTPMSFVRLLADYFRAALPLRVHQSQPRGLFPRESYVEVEAKDSFRELLYRPLFAAFGLGLRKLRWLQHGRVHLYVLYIALTVLALLIWKLD